MSLRELLEHISPGILASNEMPWWPPDVFAITATILQKSGAYMQVGREWPPKKYRENSQKNPSANYETAMRKLGSAWRVTWSNNKRPPADLLRRWKIIAGAADKHLNVVREAPELCEALLELCAAADEASVGLGLPRMDVSVSRRSLAFSSKPSVEANLAYETREVLEHRHKYHGHTLCKTIHPSRARVLPKSHTPQSGLTIRSISRNLALCTAEETRTFWCRSRFDAFGESSSSKENSINLLLIPWPERIRPAQFLTSTVATCLPARYGFFDYCPEKASPRILETFLDAEQLAGRIHGVVLPELSLKEAHFEKASKQLRKRDAFLIAGIADELNQSQGNRLRFDVPLRIVGAPKQYQPGADDHYKIFQWKHHRWKLDKSQIRQYGLGARLDPENLWWENTPMVERSISFVSMHHWLTVCALICEDLARPDPVADIVRAVGPNLVVALLMDGPQLASRWPGRYATVLADDPGCSVLTVSSVGMTDLSRPPGVDSSPGIVALWKDRSSGAIEIRMPENASGIVLSLTVEYLEEWTADGRSDGCTTGYPILSGIHPVPKRAPRGSKRR